MKSALLNILFKVSLTTSVIILSAIFAGAVFAGGAKAQSISKTKISITIQDAGIQQVLEAIEEKTEYTFHFKSSTLKKVDEQISLDANGETVADVLRAISEKTGLTFRQVNGTIIVSKTERSKKVDESNKDDQANAGALDRTISGSVTDDKGEPLIGTTVLIKGTRIGTITDRNGNYRLSIPQSLLDAGEDLVLEISFVGFETQDIPIGTRTVIDVKMVESSLALEGVEVVSTGYYEVEQRLNPGNIVKVDAKTIEQQPVSNPLEALQGRLTGVNITQDSGVPGSGFTIRIRGQNSLRDGQSGTVPGNDPLYLINGIPYPAQSLSFNVGVNTSRINPLNFINPNDIESIEILKDADATAIYGTRGANGVVRITTKQAKKGQLQVTYNGSIGFGTVENKIDVLNTEQYLEMRREAIRNDGVEPSATDVDINGTWSEDRNVDWQEEFLGGSSNFSNHQLSFSGGSNNTSFLLGLNYLKQTFIFSDDFFDEKFSTNLNINHISTDRKFEMNFQGNFVVNNNLSFFNNLAATAVTLAPNAPELFDENGNLNWENGTFNNPMAAILRDVETNSLNWTGNVSLSYEVMEGLRIKSLVGYSELRSEEIFLQPVAANNPFIPNNNVGGAQFGTSSASTWSVEPQIEYQRKIDEHEFIALVGATLQEIVTDREQIIAEGYSSDALLRNPLAASTTRVNAIDFSEYRFNSLYARLNYVFDEKYILNLTGRRDGSSRFGPGDRFANFGAVGAAWLFSEEDFISENLPFLSFGKLRGSYGLTGSDAIGNYQFLELFEPTEFGYDGSTGLFPETLPNAVFAWEETTKAEVGLELGFLDDRFRINTSYFKNNSSNQLIGQPLPAITGFSRIQANFPAEVENTGWELELNTINISKGDFRWSSNFNISILRNELVSFDNIENTTFASTYTVGEPLSAVNLLEYTGVDPETGIATYRDVDGDGRIILQEDALPLADLAPDFFGGFGNTLSYKGLTLDFFFRFVKQDGRSFNGQFLTPGLASNQPVGALNRWQNPGDATGTPRFTQVGVARTANDNLNNSTGGIEDASFIRLQNVSISYQVPSNLISKYRLQSLRLYVQGQNLLTFTGYRGWDPETQSLSLPPLRILTTGLSLTF